jgi:hypothetical protein
MEPFKYFNAIFRESFWVSLSAIATATLAIFTWRSLKQSKKEKEIQIKREIIEKVYNIIFQNLKIILDGRKIENFENVYPNYWAWEEIKSSDPFIAYHYLIPQNLFKELNEFSKKIKEYEKIRVSLRGSFEVILTEFVRQENILPEIKNNVVRIYNISYYEYNGLISKNISIFDVFFWNKNLSCKEKLKGHFFIDYSVLMPDENHKRKEITVEDFYKISERVIQNRDYIIERLSQEEFKKINDVYNFAKHLKDEIEKIINLWTKERL